jgi:hypothetical protein
MIGLLFKRGTSTPFPGQSSGWNKNSPLALIRTLAQEIFMRGVLLWLIGIPVPVIILLYLFGGMGH